ncbi:MAG: indolepyruvate oxidoreductase subunit beta [Spirochaetia bacterium]|jgi:indolepyruvate ferredoxin oxidoreductase beta subunit|nr:indolepyruvate oxidoreductase subunit beta [Spirochaetia bacterium]
MKFDIILAGVGGQGVLSLAAIIATGAMKDNLKVRQSEVHGMAQRGGEVLSHLRISDSEISSDLVAKGTASLIISMEPLEVLRYVDFLSPDGFIVTASEPFINIPDYPDIEIIYGKIKKLKNHKIIKSLELAKKAGSSRAANMVIIGAASSVLPVSSSSLKAAVEELFSSKGKDIIDVNLKAFELGAE